MQPAHETKKSILLVDDEVHVRDGLSEILQQEGFYVETAGDGREALSLSVNKKFDLMITDIKMPEMDGMQLLDEIQKVNPGIRVIMVTAFGDVETYLKSMQLGAHEYINKPVKIQELKRVIATIMDQP
ncbi:MAG: response regulator [Deltaproteobacteria bacterium]|nr:response regulator [Deltaproteobacteria bacterium]